MIYGIVRSKKNKKTPRGAQLGDINGHKLQCVLKRCEINATRVAPLLIVARKQFLWVVVVVVGTGGSCRVDVSKEGVHVFMNRVACGGHAGIKNRWHDEDAQPKPMVLLS